MSNHHDVFLRKHLWTSALDIDPAGNFLYLGKREFHFSQLFITSFYFMSLLHGYGYSCTYICYVLVIVGGGIESSHVQVNTSTSSSGWISMAYLGGGTSGDTARKSSTIPLTVVATSEIPGAPIQDMIIQEGNIVTGGAQPLIKYWSKSTLGILM